MAKILGRTGHKRSHEPPCLIGSAAYLRRHRNLSPWDGPTKPSHFQSLSDLVYKLVSRHGHCGHPSLRKWSSLGPTPIWHDAPSVSRLHLPGTSCLQRLDCATALLLSNDIWRHICLPSTIPYGHQCLCIFGPHGVLQDAVVSGTAQIIWAAPRSGNKSYYFAQEKVFFII